MLSSLQQPFHGHMVGYPQACRFPWAPVQTTDSTLPTCVCQAQGVGATVWLKQIGLPLKTDTLTSEGWIFMRIVYYTRCTSPPMVANNGPSFFDESPLLRAARRIA